MPAGKSLSLSALLQNTRHLLCAYAISLLHSQITLGQRELVLISLILPYFFLKLLTAQYFPTFKFSQSMTLLFALFAAFGIMQNIFYISIFIFLDIYIKFFSLSQHKHHYDNIFFYLVILILSLLIYFAFPNYITTIIPLVLCYEKGYDSNIVTILLSIYSFFPVLAVSLVLINAYKFKNQHAICMITLATLASWLIYFFEQKIWFYHIYPAYFFSLLIFAFILSFNVKQFSTGKDFKPNSITVFIALGSVLYILLNMTRVNIYLVKNFYDQKNVWNQWITYTNQHFLPTEKLFYFNNYTSPGYAIPIYTQPEVVSPWFNAWFIPYIVKLSHLKQTHLCNLQHDIKLFFSIFERSLQKNQPDVIIVQVPNNPKLKEPGLQFANIFTIEKLTLYLHLKGYYLYDFYKNNYIFKRVRIRENI